MEQSSPSHHVFRFGVFELDRRAGELRKNGLKIHLQEQPVQILAMLVERPGEVVTREDLRQKLWADDTFVDFDQGLNRAVNKIREALGDSANNPRFVETLPRRGYRFIAPVQGPSADSPNDSRAEAGQADPRSANGPSQEQATRGRIDQADPSWRRRLPWVLFAVTAIGLLVVSFLNFRDTPSEAPEAPLRKFTLNPPVDLALYNLIGPAISPNGKHIAFIEAAATEADNSKLWIQDVETGQARAIAEGGARPFWSPGSDFVGFFGGGIMKVAVQGGPAIRVCEIRSYPSFGASWSPDGNSIVFATGSPALLYEVPAGGGTPRPLDLPEHASSAAEGPPGAAQWPHFLPLKAGARVLVYRSVGGNGATMVAHDLETGRREVLGPRIFPFYSPSGHLLYQPSFYTDQIWALPFSLETLKATGEAFPVADGRFPTVSADQTLVYAHRAPEQRQLVWLDRDGNQIEEISSVQRDIRDPVLSTDDRRLVYRTIDRGNWDVWVWDLDRGRKEKLTTHPATDLNAFLSPDGQQVAFSSDRAGSFGFDLFLKPTDGSRAAKAMAATSGWETTTDWSWNGKYLLYIVDNPGTGGDLWYLARNEEDGKWDAHPFLQTPFDEIWARFSPNGQYVAYTSYQSGQWEIYVQPFPEGGRRETVSNNGGRKPRWRGDGKELFYLEGNRLMAVPVSADTSFSAGRPTPLFEHPSLKERWDLQYDVSADGQRFVIAEEVGESPKPSIQVVQNWFAEFSHRERD